MLNLKCSFELFGTALSQIKEIEMNAQWWAGWKNTKPGFWEWERVIADGLDHHEAYAKMNEKGLYSVHQKIFGPYQTQSMAQNAKIPIPRNYA